MIQNENINEHKLHFKASMPNGFWIKNDRAFRMETMGVCRACLAAEVGRDWSFSVYKANTIHLHTEPVPVFFRRPANEHTAQDFAASELGLRIGWLSRGKKREFGRAYLPREVRKDLSAWKCLEGDKNRFTQTR